MSYSAAPLVATRLVTTRVNMAMKFPKRKGELVPIIVVVKKKDSVQKKKGKLVVAMKVAMKKSAKKKSV